MKIILDNVGKKFRREWIVRNFSHQFELNRHVVILGPNGSGKSTLLQLIAAFMSPTEGTVTYENSTGPIDSGKIYENVSYSSPYLEIHEKLTLEETIDFHRNMKGFLDNKTTGDIIEEIGIADQKNKQIGSFSSGVRMRIKNALAILSNNPVVLLDEPLSNIDVKGKQWYADMIGKYRENRLFIVCSNEVESEYFFCEEEIHTSSIR